MIVMMIIGMDIIVDCELYFEFGNVLNNSFDLIYRVVLMCVIFWIFCEDGNV